VIFANRTSINQTPGLIFKTYPKPKVYFFVISANRTSITQTPGLILKPTLNKGI
jgi:hypothetical protein